MRITKKSVEAIALPNKGKREELWDIVPLTTSRSTDHNDLSPMMTMHCPPDTNGQTT